MNIDDVLIKTSIYRGFSIAMFDYWRVNGSQPTRHLWKPFATASPAISRAPMWQLNLFSLGFGVGIVLPSRN
jgi:hypothetical protein